MRILIAACCTMLLCASAHAAQITYAVDEGNRTNGFTTTLPAFNPALGSLTGAHFDLDGDMSFSVTNSFSAPIDVMAAFSVGLTINGPALSPRNPNSTPDFTGVYNWSLLTVMAPGTQGHDFIVDLSRSADLPLAPLIGTGSVIMNTGWSEDSDVCMSYDLLGRFGSIFPYLQCTTNAHLQASVTYTYDPAAVPAPASAALLLLGLGMMLRRRTV